VVAVSVGIEELVALLQLVLACSMGDDGGGEGGGAAVSRWFVILGFELLFLLLRAALRCHQPIFF